MKAIGAMLPYTRWLNYCDVAYLVSDDTARTRFGNVIEDLEQVSEADAAARTSALRRVRNAFVFRAGGPASAPQHILAEACALSSSYAAARRQSSSGSTTPPGARAGPAQPLAGGDHAGCMLGQRSK